MEQEKKNKSSTTSAKTPKLIPNFSGTESIEEKTIMGKPAKEKVSTELKNCKLLDIKDNKNQSDRLILIWKTFPN